MKESYQIPGSDYSIFQVLKAFISATSIRVGTSELQVTNMGRNVGGAFEGDACHVAK